ncbi:MAG: translocation/assembly module TamB domain-containing protein, partial [Caulobacteraceae bacterium]
GSRGLIVEGAIADASRILSAPAMGAASFRGGLGGDAGHWVLRGAGAVERVATAGYGLARLAGPVRVEAHGGDLDIEASPVGEGGVGKGLAAALLGGRPRAATRLTLFKDGRVLIRAFTLDGAGVKVAATGSRSILGGLSFKGRATIDNLAAAGVGASGVVEASWSASQASGAKPWSVTVDAKGARFASGMAELDRLLGPAPRLRARADIGPSVTAVSMVTIDGAAGSLDAAGLVGPAGALRLKLDWRAQGPLEVGPLRIAGTAKGTGAVTGTLADPKADLLADFSAIDLPVLPLRDAHVVLAFRGGAAGSSGRFGIAAQSQYGPAHATSDFHFAPAGLDLSGLALNAAGVSATGALSLRANAPSSADLKVAIGTGALLVAGHVGGTLKIVAGKGAPHVSLSLTAVDAVTRQGDVAAKRLSLTAEGPLDRLPYTIDAAGGAGSGPWRLAGTGVFSGTANENQVVFNGAGRVGRADFKTREAAVVRFGPHGDNARLRLTVGAGTADIDAARTAGAIDVKADVANLGLSLINEDYIGRFDARLALAGHGPVLTGTLRARIAGAGGRDLKGAAPIDGVIDADLVPGALRLNASLGDGHAMKADIRLTLPAEASAAPFRIAIDRRRPIAGRFDVAGELRPLWDLTYGGESTLSGRLIASGTLAGTLADPRALGTAALDEGRFQDSTTGLKLERVTLRATLANNAIDISRFSGTDAGKGTLEGSGRINLARDSVSSFQLHLNGFRLIDNDLGQATASGQVSVNRAANGKVKLSGVLVIDRALLAPNPPVPSGVVPMEVIEVHRPEAIVQRAAPAAKPQAPVELAIGLKAPGGIFIRGKGLNVELSLDAHVGGDSAAPILTGVAHVVRGDYNFAGKRFVIDDRGVIYLGATPETIRLDLTASRDDPTITAVIRIQGTAAHPVITLTSTPVLPQDEVLSQLLFGSSATQLSPLEAAQLASALAGLAGNGGFDIIGGLRNFAHLDRLAFGSTAARGTTVSGGKYITDKIYLEITGGGREGSVAQVEWRVRRHLSLLSRLTSQGDSQLSIRWRRDY